MLLLVAGNGLHHGWSSVTDQQKWQNLETHIFKRQFLTPQKILPKIKKKIHFLSSNFLVRTLQCKKKINFCAHENMKKQPSKVAHNS